MDTFRFLVGLAVGFVVGWFVLKRRPEPDLTNAELIEVDLLD